MARRVRVDLIGDARSMNRAFKSAGINAKKFEHQAGRTRKIAGAAFKGMAVAGVIGAGLVVKGLKDSIKAAIESQQVDAQTAAALKSTGKAAKITAKQIEALATSISFKTGIDDEAVQSTENLLLTFTRIRNEVGKGNKVFSQATMLVQDMSVALKQDAKSSALQLGKALNDPIRGMTALRRVGVQFTDSQQDQIKALVKSGQLLKAQKLILAEVRKEFGGSAKAAGKTFGGQMKLLQVHVENLEESVGKLLLPVLTRWTRNINEWLSKAKNQRKLIHDLKVAAKVVSVAFKVFAFWIRAVIKIMGPAVRIWIRAGKVLYHLGKAFYAFYKTARKHTADFFNWIKKMGLKIALAIVEPFSHLPGKMGKWARNAKNALSEALAEAEGTAASGGAPAKKTRRGQIASPVPGAIPGAGGQLRPDSQGHPTRGGGGKSRQREDAHFHIYIDGREVTKVVTTRQQRHRRRNGTQRTGRHPGAN